VAYHSDGESGSSSGEDEGDDNSCPLPLAEGWSELVDEATGVLYFWNSATQESRWERPVGRGKKRPRQEEEAAETSPESGGKDGEKDGDDGDEEAKARQAAMEVGWRGHHRVSQGERLEV
jgi:hypothetical protein